MVLQNPIYIGKVRHKDLIYDGLHEPIIEQGLWDHVQKRINFNRVVRKNGSNAKNPSLLAGMIMDQNGRRLTPSHANKNGHRYRYYVSKPNIGGMTTKAANEKLSIPAAELERLVCDRIIQFLRDDGEIADAIGEYTLSASELDNTIDAARRCADSFHELGMLGQRQLLTSMIQSIQICPEHIEIIIKPSGLLEATDTSEHDVDAKLVEPEKLITLSIKASLKRCGIEKRLVIGGRRRHESNQPDKALLQLLSRAHCYKDMLLTSNDGSISELAEQVGVTSSYFSRIVRLGFLSPDIVYAFMNGKQPATLTARQLAHDTNLAINWNDQREQLGIGNSK